MNKKFSLILVVAVVLAIILWVINSQAANQSLVRKIVVFKSGVLNEPAGEADE